MTIPNFNPEEFSQNLAKQAQGLLPDDLNEYQKNYVVNKLYQFCILAGNAINQDANIELTAKQANVIVQLIGEWTFHKNVDLIRAKIAEDNWDPILQQVAFAVFETAKHVELNKIEQEQALKMIEEVVRDSYNKSLMELARNGKIKEEEIPEIMSYSNIDEMVEEKQPEITKDQEDKILKCASLALVLKSMPPEKVTKILSGMDQETARRILYFINTPGLEQKIDSNIANTFLSTFKQTFITQKTSTPAVTLGKITSLKDLYDEYFIIKNVKFERPAIQQLVQNCLAKKSNSKNNISPYIENIVYDYLVAKLTA